VQRCCLSTPDVKIHADNASSEGFWIAINIIYYGPLRRA